MTKRERFDAFVCAMLKNPNLMIGEGDLKPSVETLMRLAAYMIWFDKEYGLSTFTHDYSRPASAI
jgi:hypothetical protein